MKKYKLIGLTGPTGAGKSTAATAFRERGYSVVDADILARKAMENPAALRCVSGFFGEDIIKNGTLDRRLLAQRAFADREKTALLNSITHPFITSLFVEELKRIVETGRDKIVFDAPQLFESNLNLLCDLVVCVTAPRDVRLERIVKRDSISPQLAKKRMDAQYCDKFFRDNSDYILDNSSTQEELRQKVFLLTESI